nr:CZB domain-containing protein [Methylomonas lenta]
MYKFEVYKVLFQLSQKSVEDFAQHTECRLGKWYYGGEGKNCFSQLPGYRDIEQPHVTIHESAIGALKAYEKNDTVAMLKQIGSMEEASLLVLANLEKMVRSAEENPSILCQSH